MPISPSVTTINISSISLDIQIWHIELRHTWCACTFPPVANMAARRGGSLLFQRCIFCSREALKRSRELDVRSFSRTKHAFVVSSSRGGIFFATGENLPFRVS